MDHRPASASGSQLVGTRRRLLRVAALTLPGLSAASFRPIWGTEASDVAFTHGGGDGNRLIAGRGNLPEISPVDVSLAGRPQWVAGLPADAGAITWVAILEDGAISTWQTRGQRVEPVTLDSGPTTLPAGAPPSLVADETGVKLLTVPERLAPSPVSPPALIGNDIAFIDRDGDLVFVATDQPDRELARYAVNALPDARLVHDETGQVLTLAGATADRYVHGVLGDDLEAGGFVIARPGEGALIADVTLPEPHVIEGIAPIWIDVDDDGHRELVVTLSNAAEGGRLALLSEQGMVLALGPGFGQGGRWRHPLAVAPFGPDGELEIASIRTPHIGGVVEFSRWERDRLTTVAELAGYSSHVLGSRNLDMALAADFDGDDAIELLVPNQERTVLTGIRRTTSGDGAEAVWELPLDGALNTNLAAVVGSNGGLNVAAGRAGDALRLWLAP